MKLYRASVVERAMKIQEVILRAMAKKINWVQAAEIIGITPRQMRRGQPSPRRVAVKTVEQVLGLYQQRYFDFNKNERCQTWT